jgi:hypothetical protein
MHNARVGDDLDYLIVTKPGRVWLSRLFAVALVRWVRGCGYTICPNYVVAEDALVQQRRDLFIAHEVTQMVPIFGRQVYDEMRRQNDWSSDYLPNAVNAYYTIDEHSSGMFWMSIKGLAEILLGGVVGDQLEAWEHRRKVRRFHQEKRADSSEAQLDRSQVKGHFDDFGLKVLNKYYGRLRHFRLADGQMAGD